MSNSSILSDVDPQFLNALCSNSSEDVAATLRATNTATALGVMTQLLQVSKNCEVMFKGISERLFSLNKRIDQSQKKVLEQQAKMVGKERILCYNDLNLAIAESFEETMSISTGTFDFFSLPIETSKSKTAPKALPDLSGISKLIDDDICIETEFMSNTKKPVTALRRREVPKKSPNVQQQSVSIFTSIARKYKQNPRSTRLSVSFSHNQPEMASAVLPHTTQIPMIVDTSKPLKQAVAAEAITPPPPAKPLQQSAVSSGSSSSSSSSSSLRVKLTTEADIYTPPLDIFNNPLPRQQRSLPPPPPPPAAFMQRSPSSSSVHSTPVTETLPHRPLPFLGDLAAAASARQNTANEPHRPIEPVKPVTETFPHRPLPFLGDLAAAVASRHNKPVEPIPTPTKSTPTPTPTPTPMRIPMNLLSEIAVAGNSRLERVAAAQNNTGNCSPTVSHNSSLGVVRRTGTLNRGNSVNQRYATGVLNSLRGGRGTLCVTDDGEKKEEKKQPVNSLFSEIRGFDVSRLKKVERVANNGSGHRTGNRGDPMNEKKNGEPSIADLLKSRLEVMQTDSESDSDDSRLDFSDCFVCLSTIINHISAIN